MRILCRRPATYQPHPAWFPRPLTFPAPRHSQVGCLSSIVTKKVPKDVGRKRFIQATPQFNVCLMSLKPTLVVQGGTRSSQLANQRSQPQRVPAPLPLYQANTNRGHPCTTQATQQIQRLPPPPVHRFPPLQATAPLRLQPPLSRTPPASPPPRPRPQPRRQPLHRLSPNPRRICHSR